MNERPLKRRKRVIADYNYYDFLTFPAAGDFSSGGTPFRSAVQRFLSTHARPMFPNTLFPRLMTWTIQFRVGNGNSPVVAGEGEDDVVTLYVVEEDVARSSRSVYCDQCRVVGESTTPIPILFRIIFIINICIYYNAFSLFLIINIKNTEYS